MQPPPGSAILAHMQKRRANQRRYSSRITLTLAVLLLSACGGSPDAPAADDLATATPGGSISVSLIGAEAGQVSDSSGDQPQLLDSSAATATAQVDLSPPAECPEPGTATLPAAAPPFTDYAELLVEYLSVGGPPTILEASLRGWGAITESYGLVRADRDFTGDGIPEVFVMALDPTQLELVPPPGDLLIFGCDAGRYRLLHQVGYAVDRGAPNLHWADDLNGDYANEMVYSTDTCGATTCVRDVQAISWNNTLESFENITSEQISEPFAGVDAPDLDGDGVRELLIMAGADASAGAGPQRITTSTYRWNGTQYILSDRTVSPPEYRIHVIHDADDKLLAGAYDEAIALYQQAASDGRLTSWTYPDESAHLNAFARFRLVVAFALKSDPGNSQITRDGLVNEYSIEATPFVPSGDVNIDGGFLSIDDSKPGAVFVRMADTFWQEYNASRDVSRACGAVTGYARSNANALEVLNSFGYTNREYTPEDMCPFGS